MEASEGDLTSRGYGAVLWEPDDKTIRNARVTRFMTWLAGRGQAFHGYQDLWQWSVTDPAAFWSAVWDYFEVLGDRGNGPVLAGEVMPDVQWFPAEDRVDRSRPYGHNL
jgi:acetoacetyl-CoA synthetase